MNQFAQRPLSALSLRREIGGRNVLHGAEQEHEVSFGNIPSVIFHANEEGKHGNFLATSYRRICANPDWNRRLRKPYSGSADVPRSTDRRRFELDCANSSDALLMNIFCYPGLLHRPAICALLGIRPGLRPEFGVRAMLPMRRDETDRTELDMRLGCLLVEAKLTETGFGKASRDRVLRYLDIEETFELDQLPWSPGGLAGYQLVRGVLAAQREQASFVLLCDGRRADLHDTWFRVLQAVRSYDLRSRMGLLSWQELAAAAPPTMQRFLAVKYGILVR